MERPERGVVEEILRFRSSFRVTCHSEGAEQPKNLGGGMGEMRIAGLPEERVGT